MRNHTAPSSLHASTRARAIIFCLAGALACTASFAQTVASAPHTAARQKAQQALAALPLLFEKNQGQTSSSVSFQSRTPQYTLLLTGQDATIVSLKKSNKTSKPVGVALRMHWVGANSAATAAGDEVVAARSNYFIGNDASQWHTGVSNYQRVRLDNLYPGIDLVYYGNQQTLEYDLTVAPGSDPAAAHLRIEGAKSLRIDRPTGDLLVRDATGSEMRLHKPIIYQGNPQAKHIVQGTYTLSADNTVTFHVGPYDHTEPLIIDPSVVYSATFGASSPASGTNSSTSYYMGMAVDSSGFVYMGGYVNGNIDTVPTTTGSFQPACATYNYSTTTNICQNFFIAKFDPTKSGAASLVYATYIGGALGGGTTGPSNKGSISGASKGNGSGSAGGNIGSQGGDLAIDSSGNVYFTGITGSNTYPTTTGSYEPTCNIAGTSCAGAVLTKLNATGSALLYSTYLLTPASAGIISPSGYVNGYGLQPSFIAVDGQQVAYIAGQATGLIGTDNSSCTASACNSDYFVAALDTTKTGTTALIYAEYLPMLINSLAADSAGNAYVGGEAAYIATANTSTQTFNFNGFQTTPGQQYNNNIGGTLVRLNHAGVNTYATYVGQGYGNYIGIDAVSVDANGTAYIGGGISGPVAQVNGLPSTSSYAGSAPYIAKVDTTKTGMASLLYGTFLSTQSGDSTYAVADDGAGKVAFSVFVSDSIDPYYPYTNVLTQPAKEGDGSKINDNFLGGVIDTTQTGTAAVLFLSPLNGVSFAYNVALDSSYNFYVAGGGSNNTDFLTVSASYLVTNAQPFFYKIPLATAPKSSITVSPSSLTFASQVINTKSAAQSVTVTNSGSTAVTFTGIAATVQFAGTDTCSPSLAANSTCTIGVTFTPTAVASPTGTLTLTDSDTSSPQTVSLSGTGIAGTPTASLSPTTIAFGNQTANTTSNAQVVTLANTGTAALAISGITLTGTNPTDFSINATACGTSLAAGSSCNISVYFNPLSTASYAASLSVADNATNSPQTTTLSGTGTATPAPIASLTPGSLTFANTTVGSTTASQTLTLSNTGNAPLTSIAITLGGTNPTDFAYTTTCGTTLAASSTCSIAVTFTPLSTASFTASITVADNAPNTPQSSTLSGTGTAIPAPIATLSPSSLTFANTTVGTTTAAQTLTLSNSGNATLNITGISLTGANPTDFADTTTCGNTLAAGNNCTISVIFTPLSAASFTATISIADNASNSSQTSTLSGTGIPIVATDFSIVSPTPPQSVPSGSSAAFTINLAALTGSYNTPIVMSVSGLPTNALATFTPATLTPGISTASTILAIKTPSLLATGQHQIPNSPWLASLFILPLLAYRRRLRGLACLLIAGVMLSLTLGCAGGYFGPQAHTYTLTVTGTSGATQHSTTVVLTVQ